MSNWQSAPAGSLYMTHYARALRSTCRRGTTVVETALVLPVFLLFVLGLIELGHAVMVKNVLRSACRQAARLGSTEGKTTAQARQKVIDVLGAACNSAAVNVYVKDASLFDSSTPPSTSSSSLENLANIELSQAAPRQLFLVRAKVNYNDIAIVPNIPYLGNYLDNLTIDGQSFMRHE